MKITKWLSVIALSATATTYSFAASPEPAAATEANEPVVSINGQTVSNEELTSFAIQLETMEGRRFPTQEALLDELILTRLADKIPTTATLPKEDELSPSPTPYASAAQRVLLKRELQKWISSNLNVPRDEMEKWYESNNRKYTKPEHVHAYHLFMETSDDEASSSPENVRSRLKDLKTQIEGGTSFSLLAREHSEAASGQAGGEIGQITRRMPIGPLSKPMNLELENAFFELEPLKVSDVVETKHGMHLLYVTEKATTQTPTLDDLITSGILPGALAQDRITSEIRSKIASTVEKHGGKVLPGNSAEITTDTVAFQLNGKDYTIGNLITVFGPRFTGYLDSAKSEPEELNELMKQAMEDEALVTAAIDQGIDKKPEIASQLKEIAIREKARKHIDAIAEAEAEVTEADLLARYEQIKEELRQPEASGKLITILSEESSGTAEQAHARERANKKAEDIRKRLETEKLTDVLKELESGKDKLVSVANIELHTIGTTTDTETRLFDQAVTGITGTRGISQPVPVGPNFTVAYLDKRLPGEPLPLEKIEPRLKAIVTQDKQTAVRRDMAQRLEQSSDIKFLKGATKYGKGKPDPTAPVGSSND